MLRGMALKMIRKILIAAALLGMSASLYATPVLQVGNGSGEWVWDETSQTWMTPDASGASIILTALDRAFEVEGDLTAYLVVSAVPQSSTDPAFQISGDSIFDTVYEYGITEPVTTSHNDLGDHSIFDTYFQVFEVDFTGAEGEVCNVSPDDPEQGCFAGYLLDVSFVISNLALGVDGVHFDLYTLTADGGLASFAPFSHDAEFRVPEPATLALFGLGLIGLGASRRWKS